MSEWDEKFAQAVETAEGADQRVVQLRESISDGLWDADSTGQRPEGRPAAHQQGLEAFQRARPLVDEAAEGYRQAGELFRQSTDEVAPAMANQCDARVEALEAYGKAIDTGVEQRAPQWRVMARYVDERIPGISHSRLHDSEVGGLTYNASLEKLSDAKPSDPQTWRPEMTGDVAKSLMYVRHVEQLKAANDRAIETGQVVFSPEPGDSPTTATNGAALRAELEGKLMDDEQKNIARQWKREMNGLVRETSQGEAELFSKPRGIAEADQLRKDKPLEATAHNDRWAERNLGIPQMPAHGVSAWAPVATGTHLQKQQQRLVQVQNQRQVSAADPSSSLELNSPTPGNPGLG